MKSISSPANTRTSPIELRAQAFTEVAETSVPKNHVVFTEENLLRIGYQDKVATSAGTKQSKEAVLRELGDRGEGPSEVHKYPDKEAALLSTPSDWDSKGHETLSGCENKGAASVSPYSDQDSEGKETISGEEEDKQEAASAPSHSERNKTIFGGVKNKEASSLYPHSIRNETISGGNRKAALLSSHSGGNTTNEAASLSARSDWDSEENKTISVSQAKKNTASLSSQSTRHQAVSGEAEDNDPASISPYSGRDSEGNGTISGSEEDKESASISPRSEVNKTIFVSEQDNEAASLFSYSDRDSEGYKTHSGGEEEKSPVSLFSYSYRYSEGYKTISAGEEDREQAAYSPYSDGYIEGCKTISRRKEDKEPGLLSPHSARDSGWQISASVCDEEAKEASASPKLAHDPARALTTSACEEEPQENKETEKYKTYVELFISKIVYHIHIKANMDPQCNDDLIVCLNQYIWEKVKDEDMCITDASFKKMDNKIDKVLHKQLGNPNKVLFLLKYSDKPIVADCMVSILGQLLKKPSKKSNIFCRFFHQGGQIL